MGSLHDRWGAMDAEQLRAELFRQFCSEGVMRMAEFERIQRLEKRIGEQRQRINQLQDERHEMGIKLAHALAAEAARPRVETTPAGATVDTPDNNLATLTRERDEARAEVRELRMQILSDECQHQENYQRAEAMEHAKNEYATLAYERGREIERLRAVVEAARGLVSFCDDPNGSEKPESLACGLARLLPDMRAALTLPRTEGETET